MLFLSCENEGIINKKHLFTLMTDDSVKYWDIVYEDKLFDITESLVFPYYSYSFSKDGEYFVFHKRGKSRARIIGSDAIKLNYWKYISDSIIDVNGELAQILYLSEDTLKYKKQNDSSIVILSKSKHQTSTINTIEIAPDMISSPAKSE